MVSVGKINGNRIRCRFAPGTPYLPTLKRGRVIPCRSQVRGPLVLVFSYFPLFYTIDGLEINTFVVFRYKFEFQI